MIDQWARLLYGGRYSLALGIIGSLFAAIGGTGLGVIAGYFGGQAENLIMRFCDIWTAIPGTLLCIVVSTALGPGFFNTIVALSIDQLDEVRNQTAKQSEALAEGVDSWKNVKHDLGAMISVEDTAEVEEIDSGYSATVHAVFEKREMDFGITTDREGAITSVSFVPEYTLGENMEQAAMNMVMGMGTVFIVLINY